MTSCSLPSTGRRPSRIHFARTRGEMGRRLETSRTRQGIDAVGVHGSDTPQPYTTPARFWQTLCYTEQREEGTTEIPFCESTNGREPSEIEGAAYAQASRQKSGPSAGRNQRATRARLS